MDTDEILKQLTDAQRRELDATMAAIAQNAAADYKKDPETFSNISEPLHLNGNLYLNVSVSLHLGDKGIVHPVIENIEQFSTRDACLEAINNRTVRKAV
jgi:hypothetical protein